MTETNKKQTAPINTGGISDKGIDLNNAFATSHALRHDEDILIRLTHEYFDRLGYIEKYGSLLEAYKRSHFVSMVVNSVVEKIMRDNASPDANLKRLLDDLGIKQIPSKRVVNKHVYD